MMMFGKKMNILIVEDTDGENALRIVREFGHTAFLAVNLEEADFALNNTTWDAVLTDLHFPQLGNSEHQFRGELWDGMFREVNHAPPPTPPAGLAVAVMCKEKNTPVIVVSDLDHHFAQYVEVVLKHIGSKIILDSKDWAKALTLLGE